MYDRILEIFKLPMEEEDFEAQLTFRTEMTCELVNTLGSMEIGACCNKGLADLLREGLVIYSSIDCLPSHPHFYNSFWEKFKDCGYDINDLNDIRNFVPDAILEYLKLYEEVIKNN